MPPRKKNKNSILKFVIFFLIFAAAVSLLTLFGTYHYFARDLPDLRDITGYEPMLVNEFYSSDGKVVAEYGIEKRKLVDLDDIPQHVIDSFIAIEDKRFYQHQGFDIVGIARAIIQNTLEGEVVSGASTITQQVTKNLILTPQKTYTRKIKELILSYRIERNLTKDEILYLYLNHIYLADGNYGVQAASQSFFGKDVDEIGIAESALLAGIPKRPEYYSPRKRLDNALARQKTVLNIMADEGFINDKQKKLALEYDIKIVPRTKIESQVAPYFVEYARQYLVEKVGAEEFKKGGYKVFTTLDIEMSLAGQWAVKRGIYEYEKRQGRGFIQDRLSGSGEISRFLSSAKNRDFKNDGIYRAVVTSGSDIQNGKAKATLSIGNRKFEIKYVVSNPYGAPSGDIHIDYSKKYAPITTYDDTEILPVKLTAGDVINVSVNVGGGEIYSVKPVLGSGAQGALISMDTNGNVLSLVGGFDFEVSQFNRAVQAKRQPGSAFKPLVYSAAIDKGYTETSVLYDIPVVIKDWIPSNYDGTYAGALVLRNALAKSRNLASIRLIMDIDPKYVVNYSKKFGFESNLNPYPSLALGGSDVSLLEMVNAFTVFANDGIYKKPKFILRIYDRNGRIIEDNTGTKYIEYEKLLTQERENRRFEVLKELAAKKGFDADFGNREETKSKPADKKIEETFLTPDEFVNLLGKVPVSYFTDNENSEQVISPETAYIVTDLLKAVISEGTGARAAGLNRMAQVAGKTGTTNDFTDAWFVGYSPKVVTGVWIGKDDNSPLGSRESGSRAALPVWIDFMENALKKYQGGSFDKPGGIKFINTPYGDIPYKVDSLRESILEMLKARVETGEKGKPVNKEELEFENDQSEIDFLLRR